MSATARPTRFRSRFPINLVKATIAGLQDLRKPEEIAALRGLSVDKVLGLSAAPKAPVSTNGESVSAPADDTSSEASAEASEEVTPA